MNDAAAVGSPRPPRPFLTHFVVDGVVAAGLLFVTVIILGGSWQQVVVLAVVAGLVAAPFTRRLEARQLAERAARHAAPHDEPAGPA